ncbi:MAG: hypothetical protein HY514_00275 [Candidatus Aenigmarchaeota archaeon]|nr:hypothetical protein [Candidatus Aenigmarchaeota archaeon]
MEDFFDIGEILYQKFLLDIYRHCDKLELINISAEEKEKMAVEMVDFVGNVIKSLESKKPLIKIDQHDKRTMKKISKIVFQGVQNDEFAKSVVSYYISKKKIHRKELDSYLTIAAIAVLSKGRKADMKSLHAKITNAKPYLFRVASLLSPAVLLHEKLLTRAPKAEQEEAFAYPNFDTSFMKYID